MHNPETSSDTYLSTDILYQFHWHQAPYKMNETPTPLPPRSQKYFENRLQNSALFRLRSYFYFYYFQKEISDTLKTNVWILTFLSALK